MSNSIIPQESNLNFEEEFNKELDKLENIFETINVLPKDDFNLFKRLFNENLDAFKDFVKIEGKMNKFFAISIIALCTIFVSAIEIFALKDLPILILKSFLK